MTLGFDATAQNTVRSISEHLELLVAIIDDPELGKATLGVVSRKKIRKVRRSRPVVRKYRSRKRVFRVASVAARRALIKRRAPIMLGVFR